MRGFTQYSDIFRNSFRDILFVKNQDSIPDRVKVAREAQCPLAHGGLCKDRDAGDIAKCLAIARKVCSHVLAKPNPAGLVHKVISLDTEGRTLAEQYLLCGYARGRDPMVVAFLELEVESEGVLKLSSDGESLRVCLDTVVARRACPRHCTRVAVQVLVVKRVTLCRMNIEEVGEETPIFAEGAAHPVAPGVAPDPAGDLGDNRAARAQILVDNLGAAIRAGFEQAPDRGRRARSLAQPALGVQVVGPAGLGPAVVGPAGGDDIKDSDSDASELRDGEDERLSIGALVAKMKGKSKAVGTGPSVTDVGVSPAPSERARGAGSSADVPGSAAGAASSIREPPATGEVMPPPRPHEEPRPKRVRRDSHFKLHDRAGNHVGDLVWNPAGESLDAHCCAPEHAEKLKCAFNRTLSEGTRSAQGRPLGLLAAWLLAGPLCESRDVHFKLRRGVGPADLVQLVSFEARKQAREYVEAMPEWTAFLHRVGCKERQARSGEGPEPESMA